MSEGRMTKEDLLAKLKELHVGQETTNLREFDCEVAHRVADEALLDYIGDEKVTAAFHNDGDGRMIEVPIWAQGEGWTFVQEEGEPDCADHPYDGGKLSVAADGVLFVLPDDWDECVGWTYATPEKARQVADAILDGLL